MFYYQPEFIAPNVDQHRPFKFQIIHINYTFPLDMHTCIHGQNPYVKALTPRGTVFGNRVFKEIIKVKKGHRGGS